MNGPLHIEIPYLVDDGSRTRPVTLHGNVHLSVDPPELRDFRAVDDHTGKPCGFPATHRADAEADLLASALDMWRVR